MNEVSSLVDDVWLATHLNAPDIRIVDVRWSLAAPGAGRVKYLESHIPGAVFVDLESDLASADDGRRGRHPLPTPAAFQGAMRRAGISNSTHVVAYDDQGGAVASRLWWLLRAYGHERASLLDGGWPAWMANGRAIESGVVRSEPGDFVCERTELPSLELDAFLKAKEAGARVVDVRAPERYRGDKEPVDPRAGHIPGATNLPLEKLQRNGRLAPVDELRSVLLPLAASDETLVAACGSGVTACLLLFALDHAGVRPFSTALLYEGSFSEWARRGHLPVAMGATP